MRANDYVRPLLEVLCGQVRDAAARVVQSARPRSGGPVASPQEVVVPVVTEARGGHVDSEAIHDYRVALRRLRTLLAAAAPLFKRQPLARVRAGLRELAHAAGAVRDEEVLAETLAAFDLPAVARSRVDLWLRGRARRERQLRAAIVTGLARSEAGSPEAPALPALLALAAALPLRRKADAISARELTSSALREAGKRVLEQAARVDAESPDARHALRIRWKRVRYVAELFSAAVADDAPAAEALAHLDKAAAHMQKRLGEMHDLDGAIARVTRARALSSGDRMVVHHQLRTARAALADKLAKELPEALALL